MNSLPITLIASILRRAVNAALRYDPGSRQRLAKLSGKILQLSSTAPTATLFICPTAHGVDFLDASDHSPDTVLKGGAVDLIGLLANRRHTLANTNAEVTGDVNLLREIREIALNIDIDWEEPINAIIGTVPGHQLAQLLRGAFTWLDSARTKTNQYLFEYLTEELRVVPSESELKIFFQGVDTIRADTERLEARIKVVSSSLRREQE